MTQVKLPDGSVIEGREARKIIEWLKKEEKKKEEEERKERERALKKLKKSKARGQVFRRVCQNNSNHTFDVRAHGINDPCPTCGGRMKLQ